MGTGENCGEISGLENINCLEAFNHDPRPIFILDLKIHISHDDNLEPIFSNDALKTKPFLLEAVHGLSPPESKDSEDGLLYWEFRTWVMSQDSDENTPVTSTAVFAGLCWDYYTIQGRWRIVSTNIDMHRSTARVTKRRIRSSSYPHKALRNSITRETRFDQYAKNAPVGILLSGKDGRILYANDNWFKMVRMSREDVDSCCDTSWWAKVVHPDDLGLLHDNWERMLKEKLPMTFELKFKYGTATRPMWVLLSGYAQLYSDGTIEAIVASLTDVSDQKFAEAVQRQRVEDANEAQRQQENFIDVTSHEIRNPMMVVIQCSEEIGTMLKSVRRSCSKGSVSVSQKLIEDVIDGIETIEYCTMHQKHIIDDILTLSRADAGLLPLNPDRCQPLSVIKTTLKVFEREMLSLGIEFKFRIDDSFIAEDIDWAELDAGRLSQMLINLISNAVKFTKDRPKKAITAHLSAFVSEQIPAQPWTLDYLPCVNVKEKGDYGKEWSPTNTVFLHLSIQDTGKGLAEDEKQNLFERFCQASPRTHAKYGGSGLGLYICRTLAEMQGGRIGFNSEAGQGSVFGFYVKVKRCIPPDVSKSNSLVYRQQLQPHMNQQEQPVDVLQFAENSINSTILDIMLVEDNLINQKVLRRQLESLGHRVIIANHGKQALDILQRTAFWKGNKEPAHHLSIVLMDIEMPVMNGRDCVEHIRKLQKDGLLCSHVPVVAVTGNARSEHVESAKASGMDEVILKPFRISEIAPLLLTLSKKFSKATQRSDGKVDTSKAFVGCFDKLTTATDKL